MSVFASSGAKLYIGSLNNSTAIVLNDMQADSYVEVGELEDLGEFGDTSEDITFTSLNDGRVRHLKGPRDAGTMPATSGMDMTDEGQVAMDAAESSSSSFNFKITMDNADTGGGSGSEHYFTGKVMSKRIQVGNASNVTRKLYTVGIQTEILEVDPS